MDVKVIVLVFSSLGFILAQKDPHFAPQRNGIVHLFEWRWEDIANECEKFLGPYGYAGIQLSPPNENAVIWNNGERTWWERYQPLSYMTVTRSGNEQELADMISRCNKVGVRIFPDVVFNHMTQDRANEVGTGGNPADPSNGAFPAVPYTAEHFHWRCNITNYQDAGNVRNCELDQLHDLNQGLDYVRGKIIEYLDHLVDLGVAGFRVDAAKHMWPADLEFIFSQVKNLNTDHGFPEGARPFFVQEVIDLGGEPIKGSDYVGFGRVTDFKYGSQLGTVFRGKNPAKYLKNFGTEWGLLEDGDSLVFIDNHDNQRGGGDILTYKDSKLYKQAIAFMLAWPHGLPRIMSSYFFDYRDQGPPHDSDFNTLPVTVNDDLTCGNGWVCEHRWRQIYNMVRFKSIVDGTSVSNWWDNGNKQIAFCRGNKGFAAFNDDTSDLKQTLQTCLPQGHYCDVISGNKDGNSCTGKTVTVNGDGTAYVEILSVELDAVLAITIDSKLN